MRNLLLHIVSIAHGLAACAVFALCFHLAGSLLIPRTSDERLGRDETPALIGVAIYLVLCWFGIELGIPVKRVAAGFTIAVMLAALARYRWIRAAHQARGPFNAASRWWWGAFALLYVLAYIYTLPPVGRAYLPIAWTGNIDLLSYLLYTRHLWDLGQSNLVGYNFLDFIYLQTPGAFYLMGWLSMPFGVEPIRAAMPAQFALTAMIGLIAARISHAVFGIRRFAAVIIGCILIGAPLFRYMAGAYYLSTLLTLPVFMYLIWTTVSYRPSRGVDVPLLIRFGIAYVALFFIYPFMLFCGVGAQLGALALTALALAQEGPGAWRNAARHAGRSLAAASLSLGLLMVCFLERTKWSWDMVTGLSQVGVAGWPLELISPLAIFGFPGVRSNDIQVETAQLRILALAAFLVIALLLVLMFFWRLRRVASAPEKALAGLLGGGVVAYCAYYWLAGPSYQQWKFATYAVLPMSFVAFAAGLRLLGEVRHSFDERTVLTTGAAILVVGNLLVHAAYDAPLFRVPGALWNLQQVDKMPSFREITVRMLGNNHLFSTYLALYFLPSKRVRVISPMFKPSVPLTQENISTTTPLLLQDYGCEGIGHPDVMRIPQIGCLVLSPPSPAPDVVYPFKRSFLFIEFDWMTQREPGGRWNIRPELNLLLHADPLRARVAEDAYVNLFLNPFLPKEVAPIRLALTWGKGRTGEIGVHDQEWISLPVTSVDWTGDRSWELPIKIKFPDNRTILFHELSVSHVPRGRLVSVTP